jgi:hypothetical protein
VGRLAERLGKAVDIGRDDSARGHGGFGIIRTSDRRLFLSRLIYKLILRSESVGEARRKSADLVREPMRAGSHAAAAPWPTSFATDGHRGEQSAKCADSAIRLAPGPVEMSTSTHCRPASAGDPHDGPFAGLTEPRNGRQAKRCPGTSGHPNSNRLPSSEHLYILINGRVVSPRAKPT